MLLAPAHGPCIPYACHECSHTVLQALSRVVTSDVLRVPVLAQHLTRHPHYNDLSAAASLELMSACAQHCPQQDVGDLLIVLQSDSRCSTCLFACRRENGLHTLAAYLEQHNVPGAWQG